MRPLYTLVDQNANSANCNKGLWWDKFFDEYSDEFIKVPENGKSNWIATVTHKNVKWPISTITKFADRQYALGKSINAQQNVFETNWHFSTGLGYSHPVENGYAWHPTLGVPYLPASSVKGLLRGWVEEWEFDSETQASERKKVLSSWFGNEPTESDPEKMRAGSLIFFDAVPVGKVQLAADVMTPHMGKWYEEGGKIDNIGNRENASRIPADWNSPVPVPFLSVKDTSFLFQIAIRPGADVADKVHGFQERYDLEKAMELLQSALEHLGAGAKTAAGYGRMRNNDEALKKLAKQYLKGHKILPVATPQDADNVEVIIKEATVLEDDVITGEEVTLEAEPKTMVGKSKYCEATVRLLDGSSFLCIHVPAFQGSITANYRWNSSNNDDKKINATVTRQGGKLISVVFNSWS